MHNQNEMPTDGLDVGLILLTGATGYVGGRLLSALEEHTQRIRCLARRPEFLKARVAAGTEIVTGDVLDRRSLDEAMREVTVAYYLVHSMGSSGSFEENDREGARNFAAAARAAGVQRIIYLGGLGNDQELLSPHLRSRQEVGHILRESGVPVIEFRASVVIGSGSLSFEMIRSLVERLPIMITPKWVAKPAQPIAIDDLIAYLLTTLRVPGSANQIFEIGGSDKVSYAEIMRIYARHRGMHIRMIPVPVLTPYLSSLWLGLVTPLYARIGRKLIESIVHSTVVRDKSALGTFDIRPIGIDAAVGRALANDARKTVLPAKSVLQLLVFGTFLDPANGLAQQVQKTVLGNRPLEEKESACAPCLDGSGDRSLAADDDHLRLRIELLEPPQQLDAVDVRQGQIRQHDIRSPLFENLGPIGAAPRAAHVVTFWLDDCLEHSRHRALFIDCKDASATTSWKRVCGTEQNTSGR